jgi:hypothetical protein
VAQDGRSFSSFCASCYCRSARVGCFVASGTKVGENEGAAIGRGVADGATLGGTEGVVDGTTNEVTPIGAGVVDGNTDEGIAIGAADGTNTGAGSEDGTVVGADEGTMIGFEDGTAVRAGDGTAIGARERTSLSTDGTTMGLSEGRSNAKDASTGTLEVACPSIGTTFGMGASIGTSGWKSPSIGDTVVGAAIGAWGWLSTEATWPSIGTTVGDGTMTGTLGKEWPSIGLTARGGASVITSCGWGDERGMLGAALLTECMVVCVNGANDRAHLPKVVVFVQNICYNLLLLHARPRRGPEGATDSATSGCTVCRLLVSHANATAHHVWNRVTSLGDKGGGVWPSAGNFHSMLLLREKTRKPCSPRHCM